MLDYTLTLRRAWPILFEAIRQRRTLSYSELAGRVGPPLTARQIHRQLLTPLAARCRAAGLPDLCALVVRKDTGLPGGGWFAPSMDASPEAHWAEALTRCLEHPWKARLDPRLLETSTGEAGKMARPGRTTG